MAHLERQTAITISVSLRKAHLCGGGSQLLWSHARAGTDGGVRLIHDPEHGSQVRLHLVRVDESIAVHI